LTVSTIDVESVYVFAALPVDDTQACWSAFRVMKLLVSSWYADATTTRNPFADSQLQHFNHWVSSPLSLLHDPALHRIVRQLMAKVHGHLVAALRGFGATVVFADFSRVIIATNKLAMDEAVVRCPRLCRCVVLCCAIVSVGALVCMSCCAVLCYCVVLCHIVWCARVHVL
jgi:hypothetical protein